mgnify:CR=1 FL=1
MQKFDSTENIPTWSLPYLMNDDPSGLTDEEIKMVDDFVNQWQVQVVSPIEVDGEAQPEFSYYPLFGQAAEVEPCIVIYSKEQ